MTRGGVGPGWDISVSGSSFLFFFLFFGEKGWDEKGQTDSRSWEGQERGRYVRDERRRLSSLLTAICWSGPRAGEAFFYSFRLSHGSFFDFLSGRKH